MESAYESFAAAADRFQARLDSFHADVTPAVDSKPTELSQLSYDTAIDIADVDHANPHHDDLTTPLRSSDAMLLPVGLSLSDDMIIRTVARRAVSDGDGAHMVAVTSDYHRIVKESNDENLSARQVRSEGLYRGELPLIDERRHAELSNRLHREDLNRTTYFDGANVFDASLPTTRGLRRAEMSLPSITSPLVTTTAQVKPLSSDALSHTLFIHIRSLLFTRHPLHTAEDVECIAVKSMANECNQRRSIDLVKHFSERISALRLKAVAIADQIFQRQESQRLSSPLSIEPPHDLPLSRAQTLLDVLTELTEAREQRDREEYEERQLFKLCYDKWIYIRQLRSQITHNHIIHNGTHIIPPQNENIENQTKHVDEEKQEIAHDEHHIAIIDTAAHTQHETAENKTTLAIINESKEEKEESKEDLIKADASSLTHSLISPTHSRSAAALTLLSNEQSYIGHPTILKVRRVLRDVRKDEATWKRSRNDEVEELIMIQRLRAITGESLTLQTDMENIASRVENRMRACRRWPGRPMYIPTVADTAEVTPLIKCTHTEVTRRRTIETSAYYAAIYVNGKIVRRTKLSALSFPMFQMTIDCETLCKTYSAPSSIAVHIYHRIRLGIDDCMGIVHIPLPSCNGQPISQSTQWSGRRLTENEVRRFMAQTMRPPTSNLAPQHMQVDSPFIGGIIDTTVEWTCNDPLFQPNVSAVPRTISSATSSLLRGARIDPNDPRNNTLIAMSEAAAAVAAANSVQSQSTVYHPAQHKQIRLISDRYYHASIRKRVLKARLASDKTTSTPVPINDNDIPQSLKSIVRLSGFEADTQIAREESDIDWNAVSAESSADDKLRLLGIRHDIVDVNEVVSEMSLSQLMTAGVAITRGTRKLNVTRVQRRAVAKPPQCQLIAQIINANNIPLRSDGNATVNPQVRVTVGAETAFTTAQSGSHPHWNEILRIALPSTKDKESIAHMSGAVIIEVFDALTIESTDHARAPKTLWRATEHRLLASLTVPLTSLIQFGQINGAVNMRLPTILNAYDVDPSAPTSLTVYLTTDPLIHIPPRPPINLSALPPFHSRCVQWAQSVMTTAAVIADGRVVAPIVRDVHGDFHLVTRFMSPVIPPRGFDRPALFTRFVSQIKHVAECGQPAFNDGVNEVWMSVQQTLTLRGGDSIEHALVLANYYLAYDGTRSDQWQTFLLRGANQLEHSVAYVVRIALTDGLMNAVILIDAVTGNSYSWRDDSQRRSCPLKRIDSVMNSDNVWANIQSVSAHDTSFAILNTALWRPLFNDAFTKDFAIKRFHQSFTALTQRDVVYTELASDYYLQRTARLERIIQRAVETWRVGMNRRTNWDFGVSALMRDALSNCEYYAQSLIDNLSAVVTPALAHVKTVYPRMFGLTLTAADNGDDALLISVDDEDVDKNEFLTAIKRTALHEDEDENVVFACAVYLHRYPNGIAAVWLYMAALK